MNRANNVHSTYQIRCTMYMSKLCVSSSKRNQIFVNIKKQDIGDYIFINKSILMITHIILNILF